MKRTLLILFLLASVPALAPMTESGCDGKVELRAGDHPLHLHLYFPLTIGEIDRWIVNDETVRIGRVNGEDYAITFSPLAQFQGGATPLDDKYLVRMTIDPEEGTFRPTFDRPTLDSALSHEVDGHLDFVLDRFVEKEIIKREEAESLRRERKDLPADRTAYFVFFDPLTGEPKAVLGWLDGSRSPGLYGGVYGETWGGEPGKLQVERKFPDLVLPERISGDEVYELIRLGVSDELMDAVRPLLSLAAMTVRYKHGWAGRLPLRAGVYVVAPHSHLGLYERRYHFPPFRLPHELPLEPEATPVAIFRRDAATFEAEFRQYRRLPQWRNALPRVAPPE